MNINLVIILICCIKYTVGKKYYNYKLYRGIPVNESHLEFFKSLSDNFVVNYWRLPGIMNMPVEFVIGPDDQALFLRQAEQHGVYLTTIMDDVQKAFDMQTVKTYIRRKMDSFDWFNYFRLNDIYQWLRDLNKAFPKEMEIKSIGRSHENRDIMSVRIKLAGCINRSKVIVEGGIHAREWISPAFVTYLISQILHSAEYEDQDLKTIANTYEWYFVPVLNPDGYEYSHKEDRLWRKNRHDGENGVDLNRNFAVGFGSVGVSNQRHSEIYCGDRPFSEKESLAMANFVKSQSQDLEYYLSFHAYGQYMIIPYAHSTEHHDNYDQVKNMCNQAASRIAGRYDTRYTAGTAYDTVGYLTSGVSGCWVKRSFNVPYVVTFELRDNGNDGFALPPGKILPTCKETMDGMLSLLTPRTTQFQPTPYHKQSGQKSILDKIVVVWNVFLFIIVRFDCFCFYLFTRFVVVNQMLRF